MTQTLNIASRILHFVIVVFGRNMAAEALDCRQKQLNFRCRSLVQFKVT